MLFVLPLLAGPLAAQSRAIAPAPSLLFARPVVITDTTRTPHQGLPKWEARVIGGLTGLLVGIGLGQVVESHDPCGCDDPGLDRAISYGLSGMVVGAILGGVLLSE